MERRSSISQVGAMDQFDWFTGFYLWVHHELFGFPLNDCVMGVTDVIMGWKLVGLRILRCWQGLHSRSPLVLALACLLPNVSPSTPSSVHRHGVISAPHTKKLKNNASVENTGHFNNEIDLAGFEGLDGMEVDNIKPPPSSL